jgi:TolA-binding protein
MSAMAESKSSPSGSEAPAGEAKPPPELNMQERVEGMQGWMAEIEKKQERTSRFGAVAVILAILASGGALALGVINKQDGATTDDVDELATSVNELGASVELQTEQQLKAINARLAGLEQQVDSLSRQQRQAEARIATLQTRVDSANAAAAAAATPAPAPAAPGSKP